tara:strand:+ start:7789 stop:8418 length:630 start_codon:yes stop_codon:yes gene_type:complete
MAFIDCPSPDPTHPVYEQVSRLSDAWCAIRIGNGWVVLEPTRGWYQIDDIPPQALEELPPPAGTLKSSFLPGLLAANIQNMPGNIDSLPVGWFRKAFHGLQDLRAQLGNTAKQNVASLPRKKATKPLVDRAALRLARSDIENALAGIYPNPRLARLSIERFLVTPDSTQQCVTILHDNPSRFGEPHPVRIRWWNKDTAENLKALQELLS